MYCAFGLIEGSALFHAEGYAVPPGVGILLGKEGVGAEDRTAESRKGIPRFLPIRDMYYRIHCDLPFQNGGFPVDIRFCGALRQDGGDHVDGFPQLIDIAVGDDHLALQEFFRIDFPGRHIGAQELQGRRIHGAQRQGNRRILRPPGTRAGAADPLFPGN